MNWCLQSRYLAFCRHVYPPAGANQQPNVIFNVKKDDSGRFSSSSFDKSDLLLVSVHGKRCLGRLRTELQLCLGLAELRSAPAAAAIFEPLWRCWSATTEFMSDRNGSAVTTEALRRARLSSPAVKRALWISLFLWGFFFMFIGGLFKFYEC